MAHQSDFIVEGPPLGPVPECSLGEYLEGKIRALPEDLICEVNGDTGEKQTLGKLFEMSVRLSEGLKKLGMRENDVVGMLCRNCFKADEIVLGTWLSGATIAPFCETAKVDEIKHFFSLVEPKYIFCEEETISTVSAALSLLSMSSLLILVSKSKNSQYSHMTFEEVLVEADVKNYRAPSVKSPSTQLVAILGSSGTSGLPKAVAITHRNLIFQDITMDSVPFMNSRMDSLQISSFYWVTGVLMYLRSLTTGFVRVLLKNPNELNILKAIETYKTQTTVMAPLSALSIANNPDFEKFDVSSMEMIGIGGSPFTPSMGEKLMEKWKGVKFIQSYGTTESTGFVTSNSELRDIYSLGSVRPGVKVKIVDPETRKSLKSICVGEICVKSPGVVVGYLKNEEATREAVDEEGWLHTGDLGRFDDSGHLYFIDRLKEMIKIKNMQVSPAELENAVLCVPGVLEVGVVGVTHDGVVFELLALVVKEDNSDVTEEKIHAHIANTLSDYKKLTGGVHFVDSLPKTSSGKIRRSELRKLALKFYSKPS